MSKMRTLTDLLEHQLQDLYSAENQLIDALPKMEQKVKDSKLRECFTKHLEETKQQKNRIEEVCRILDFAPEGHKCKAIAGLIDEAQDFMDEDAEPEVMDAGILASAQRIEHYEIAGYGAACYYSDLLGYSDVAEILKETMSEEKGANDKLTRLAKETIDEKAEVH